VLGAVVLLIVLEDEHQPFTPMPRPAPAEAIFMKVSCLALLLTGMRARCRSSASQKAPSVSLGSYTPPSKEDLS
jgi:hypothetical protein